MRPFGANCALLQISLDREFENGSPQIRHGHSSSSLESESTVVTDRLELHFADLLATLAATDEFFNVTFFALGLRDFFIKSTCLCGDDVSRVALSVRLLEAGRIFGGGDKSEISCLIEVGLSENKKMII